MAKPYYGLTGKLSRQGTQLKGKIQRFSEIGDHSILRNRDAENQHPIEAIEGLSEALEGKASKSDVPKKTSDLINDSGFLTRHQDISGKLDVDGDGSEVTVDFTESETRTNIVSGGTLATAFSKIAKWLSDLGTMAFKNSVTKSDLSQAIRNSLDKADTALQEFTETDPTVPQWAKSQTKPVYTASEVGALPDSTIIPTKISQLQNDAGFLTEYTEIDPTVPQWARQETKPSYTASEVGALPDSTVIPTKLSQLQNDVGFLTEYTEIDPTVPQWARQATKPTYTAEEVGALPDETVIPSKTSELQNDSGFLTSFTEEDPTVPSWAKQPNKPTYTANEVGALPVGTPIPSKTSDLQNDSGFLTSFTETDPTVPAWAKNPTKPTYTATEVGALPIGGGTLTGPLTLSGSPTENLHPATKKYVDDIVGNIETLLASI